MKTSIKFLVAGIILLLLPLWIAKLIGIICILGCIFTCFKNFLFKLIDKIKEPASTASKQKKDVTPPWEK